MIKCNFTETVDGVTFWNVASDINGNPRYVFHWMSLDESYAAAMKKARSLGGQVYRGRWFGGGIVFTCFNLRLAAEQINELKSA